MINPFYVSGIIPDAYFCDREKETRWLIRTLDNQANILLTSPRRMGKTQLIRHAYGQASVRDSHYCFYVDIFPTTCLHELVLLLSKEIYSVLVPKGTAALNRFLSGLHSLIGSFGYDPVTGTPSFNVRLGDILTPELTLQEIFHYLDTADKPCLFAIDEFQQISNYPEKNVEALLRSYVQDTNNCQFIFAGSNRHMLENMFNSESKPFYNSAEQMYLGPIPADVYLRFAQDQFRNAGREITPAAFSLAYNLFEGHTYYVHNLLHNAFAYTDPEKTVDEDDIRFVLSFILQEREHAFSGLMNRLNYQQKETLIAIAKEGKARGITSVAFVRKHALKSPSSVQYAVSTLLDRQYITFEDERKTKVYSVTDRFLALWIKMRY